MMVPTVMHQAVLFSVPLLGDCKSEKRTNIQVNPGLINHDFLIWGITQIVTISYFNGNLHLNIGIYQSRVAINLVLAGCGPRLVNTSK